MIQRRPLIAFLALHASLCAPLPDGGNRSEASIMTGDEHDNSILHSYPTRSSSASSRTRPIHNNNNNPLKNRDVRLGISPKTNGTLSEKFATLRGGGGGSDNECRHHDFAARLRNQEQQEEDAAAALKNGDSSQTTNEESRLAWTLIGTAASLVLASTLVFSPAAVWKDAVSACNAILSIHWIRELSRQPTVAFMDAVLAVSILSRPGTIESLQKQVWPSVVSTVKTLVLAEAWSYFWKVTWQTWASFQSDSASSIDKDDDETLARPLAPTWVPVPVERLWLETSEWMDGFLKRGTRRILQKVLQKNIQDTFVRLASHGAGVFQSQWYSKTTTTTTDN